MIEVPEAIFTADEEPLYNIGVVARLTGVPVTTLRVWERRYGFPAAVRTPGGHRIYSEREVERVRWVKARIDAGMQAAQAVHALAHHERQPPALHVPAPAIEPGAPVVRTPTLAVCRERFGAALRAHDLDLAEQILGDVLVLFSLEAVILDVVRPTLADLGEGWEQGTVSVATEHLASYRVRQLLLMWLATGPPPRAVAPIVLACAPGDWHETGLLMLGVLLRRRRWPVTYLGPSVPLADLAAFVADARPPVVVLAATLPEHAEALADWPRHLKGAAATGRPVVCFGGRAFTLGPELRARVPGVYLGGGLEDAVATATGALSAATGERD